MEESAPIKLAKRLLVLESDEIKLVQAFEADCSSLDLTNPQNFKDFLILLHKTQSTINDTEKEYSIALKKLFDTNSKFLEEPLCKEAREFGSLYFGTSEASEILRRLNVFREIMDKCEFLNKKFQSPENVNKISFDLFRLLRQETGVKLLERILAGLNENKLTLQFIGMAGKICYLPQIEFLEKSGALPTFNLDTAQAQPIASSAFAIAQYLEANKKQFGVKFRPSQPLQVITDPDLISVKMVNKKLDQDHAIPCLSLCPRFISLYHELVHVARVMDGQFFKEALISTPFIALSYQNAEELFTIAMQSQYNENLLRIAVGCNARLTHLGYGLQPEKLDKLLLEMEKPESSEVAEVTKQLKKSIVVAALETGLITDENLKDRLISNINEHLEEGYQACLTSISQILRPEVSNSNTPTSS